MHEKDIELARLLLGKLAELDMQRGQLAGELSRVQGDLASQQQLRDERAAYLDILSRAADLLNRQDLREELPETSALEQQSAQLQSQIGELEQAAAQYHELVADLDQRAPHLVAIARGDEQPAPDTQAAEDQSATEPDAGLLESEPAGLELAEPGALETGTGSPEALPEPATFEPVAEAEAGPGEGGDETEIADGSAAAPAVAGAIEEAGAAAGAELDTASALAHPTEHDSEAEASLRRFNLLNLKRRESFTHGRGAAYIIDASSVLERVPNYDHYVRGIELEQAREELIRDFDVLGRELSGSFHLVFSAWFQYAAIHGNNLTVEFGTGPGEGSKEASDRRLRELVFEMTAKLRPVCVVTGDSTMADSVRGQGIHIIPLGEFFRA